MTRQGPIRRLTTAGLTLIILSPLLAQPAPAAKTALPPALVTPPPNAIDPARLESARRLAVRNGLASLLARQAVNNGLVFRPLESAKRVISGYQESQERFRWVLVDVPIRKVVAHREIRRPQTDRYGNITGYRTVKIPEYRVVGTRKERRLVRDPQGPITRTVRKPIYQKQDPLTRLPHGLMGLNGMALYVMAKAGLTTYAADQARELKILVNTAGLPDMTWDLAWLVAGFVQLDDPDFQPLTHRLVCKLIDGQIRQRGPAQGLWGPICFHHEALARYLSIETQLHQEIDRIKKQHKSTAAKNPDDQRLQTELEPYQKVLDQVRQALADTATQGGTFSLYNQQFQLQQDYYLTGLPYYFYNTLIADLDSTYLAVWALAQAADRDRLPPKTARPLIKGRALLPPENTRKTLTDALVALNRLQQRNGWWNQANLILANHAFDRFPVLQLQNVPLKKDPPPLLDALTWRSHLRGLAAFLKLAHLVQPNNTALLRRIEKSLQYAGTIVEQLLAQPAFWQRLPERHNLIHRPPPWHVYHDVEDSLEQLLENQGLWTNPTTSSAAQTDRSVEQLPAGYASEPYSLLTAIADVFAAPSAPSSPPPPAVPAVNPQTPAPSTPPADLYDRLSYRLLIQQGLDGQWDHPGWGANISSALYAYQLRNFDTRWLSRYRKAKENKQNKKMNKDWPANRAARMIRCGPVYGQGPVMNFEQSYATLAALVFLLQRIDRPIDMRRAIILSPELVKRMNPYDLPPADQDPADPSGQNPQPPAPPEPPTADDAAAEVIRPNPALKELLDDLRGKLGLTAEPAGQDGLPPTSSNPPTPGEKKNNGPDKPNAGRSIEDILAP